MEIFEELIRILFQRVPFSRTSEQIKSRVRQSMQRDFDALNTGGTQPVRALSGMLERYADFPSAARRAGCGDAEIESACHPAQLLDRRGMRRVHCRIKAAWSVGALFAALFAVYLVSGICNFSTINRVQLLITLALQGALGAGGLMLGARSLRRHDYARLALDAQGRAYIEGELDRHRKKWLNTLFILSAALSFLLFLVLFGILRQNYSLDEVAGMLSFNSLLISLGLFLLGRNGLICTTLLRFADDEARRALRRQSIAVAAGSAVYWAAAILALLLLGDVLKNPALAFCIPAAGYLLGWTVYTLGPRARLNFRNIRFNARRVLCWTLVLALIGAVRLMSRDVFSLQSYISTVPAVEHAAAEIAYDTESGVYTLTTAEDSFRILQLTDIHLGGSMMSYRQDKKALGAVYTLISHARPDLVVVTGDLVYPVAHASFSLNNSAPVREFASFMRNTGVPWVFTYGNHDTEAIASLSADEFNDLLKSLSYKTSGNLLYPYVQPDVYGRSNQLVEIRSTDGTLMQALVLLDSNSYAEGAASFSQYDYIHDDQVDWYERQILRLNAQAGKTVPSLLFFHIPLQEYREACTLWRQGSPLVDYAYGEIGEKLFAEINCSGHASRLFETAERLGSTKAMFCGHDHYNNLSVRYRGIRLTYGYSIDYLTMPGIENSTRQRGATLITVAKDGSFEIEPLRLEALSSKSKI